MRLNTLTNVFMVTVARLVVDLPAQVVMMVMPLARDQLELVQQTPLAESCLGHRITVAKT